jgi:hypothetical protein
MYYKGSNLVVRRGLTAIAAVLSIGAIAGCDDGISAVDAQFVAASMPSDFESLRMYAAAQENPLLERSAGTRSQLKQGCQGTIRTSTGYEEEMLVLDDQSAPPFDLDVTRTSGGFDVKSNGLSLPQDNPNAFRTKFIRCVAAIKDKYRAEPEKGRVKRNIDNG